MVAQQRDDGVAGFSPSRIALSATGMAAVPLCRTGHHFPSYRSSWHVGGMAGSPPELAELVQRLVGAPGRQLAALVGVRPGASSPGL